MLILKQCNRMLCASLEKAGFVKKLSKSQEKKPLQASGYMWRETVEPLYPHKQACGYRWQHFEFFQTNQIRETAATIYSNNHLKCFNYMSLQNGKLHLPEAFLYKFK